MFDLFRFLVLILGCNRHVDLYLPFILLSPTDTTDMKLIEVFEILVAYTHVLNMKACPCKLLYCSPPCIVIIKEGTNGRYSLIRDYFL